MPPPATPAAAPYGPAACAPNLTATLGEYLERYQQQLDARVLAGESSLEVGRAHARALDGLFSALLPATRATLTASGRWVDCTLAAVGSYGRGILAPRSDLDVRLVVDGPSPIAAFDRDDGARVQEVADAILYPLWDAGCHIGHQVIDVDGALRLSREDLATATSLLDLRVVAGEPQRVNGLLQRALDGFFTAELGAFVSRLREERASRHERFGGSLYLLEPDVKSGAGGLRDLDIARWAARARYHVKELDELVALGVLLPREVDELRAGQRFLWDVRSRLHCRADRRSDRLTFDAQEELGRAMGDTAAADAPAVAAQRLMAPQYGP